ncbi:DUF6334 family protein [uncultured Sphingomonas sp.]|uniref:DUF6334 family protein n=1 Tax=uncultured Sphingomonas sp. TaxID=158754 RepID=UPI0025FE6246|nr:DUF6334 family protein [uncultured Sphingomonas sp.]
MAYHTMLRFDYDEVHGQIATALLGRRDGAVGWRDVAVVIGDRAVMVRVDVDTDEIAVELEVAPDVDDGWQAIPELSDYVGTELGWCWLGRNYRGYLDMFTLSFSGLEPQVCFVGEAAIVSIKRLLPAVS